MVDREEAIPRLELPKRWEFLERRAEEAGLDVTQFVERVDSAEEHIRKLLEPVTEGRGGLFEVIFGHSGSGKTTFLKTLPKFIPLSSSFKVRVDSFDSNRDLAELPKFVEERHVPGDDHSRIIVIEERDNPTNKEVAQVEDVFGKLLVTFRKEYGQALVLWPITKPNAAHSIAKMAYDTGRDSMVDLTTNGRYVFKGVPKERYFYLADLTTRNLTGDGLEAFGVDKTVANGLLSKCETIGDFFSEVNTVASEKRDRTYSVLRRRARPKLWILLPGDDVTALDASVSALTQGAESMIDIDRMRQLLDDPNITALYLDEWRKRQAELAHLLRAIDVRLFSVPPNVALAAVRTFGDEPLKNLLKQRSLNLEQAKKALRASRFYKNILSVANKTPFKYASGAGIKDETRDEYNRIQALAASSDKLLNKALGRLIAACLSDDAPQLKVVIEKQTLPGSQLKPDIQIQLSDGEFICLEPTWRTSGAGIPGELKGKQSTLSAAFLQKYVLDKAHQYIKDLGL